MRIPPASPASRPRWWATTAIARESRDTLFLLAVVGWLVLMQSPHLPALTTVLALAVLAWRLWLAVRQKPLPSGWVRFGLLALCIALTVSQFKTIVGRDAGSALVVLLLTMKTLELKARRDAFVVFFLGFFTLLSHFFYSQSLLTALGILVGVFALLTALVNAHMPAGYPPLVQSLRMAVRMALLGTPIMVALFVLFPRFAPLWGLPTQDSAKTGLGNDMTVGHIAELAQDGSVAFRVRFAGTPPPQGALYFRGPVLSRLNGRQWTAEESAAPFIGQNQPPLRPLAQALDASPALSYEVLLQPHQKHWLLTLDMAVSAPQLPAGWRTRQLPTLEWISHRPITDVLRYQASSHVRYRTGEQATSAQLQRNLQLPPNSNPRTRQMAQEWLAQPELGNAPPAHKVQAALALLRTGGYTYTLQPGLTGPDPADTFWFDSKQGFCEHIANAFVVLMRAMQVPARIVTGYQGGEPNPMDGMWTVRQSDAHAWAEVWLPEQGWVRVDPTAAVSASRADTSTRLEPPRGAVGDAIATLSPGFATALARSLRNAWDATNTRWNNWVLNYTQDRQFDLLRQLGFSNIGWTTLVQLLVGALVLLAAVGGAWALYEKRRIDPWLRVLQAAQKRLLGMGLHMPPENTSVTPRQLLQWLQAHSHQLHPSLPPAEAAQPDWLQAWQQWLLALEAMRYAPAPNGTQAPADTLRRLQNTLRHLPVVPPK